MAKSEKIILGIDPGTTVMGYGVIKQVGKNAELLTFDVVKFKVKDDHYTRLRHIFESTQKIIEEYLPDEMALEAPFFGKNVQSMLKLGRAQGVVMAAGLARQIPVTEYPPKRVKQSITGDGNASKEKVAGMLKNIYGFKEIPKLLDATDGLAVATCHHYTSSSPLGGVKSYSGWESFLKNNPDRQR
ncbi:crossover junction endodeoxyribonuclease RuvC [Phaeocystidibacter luteus]|uniref:Crossover junction endodeoxyribonuclease RuvC n=1 Tax=Phaeocystidibacter luteus TaxID=911197 RepID=A0A6N6RI80_9FLAO|nr:crossover junction endodeoxyribonuclease RuvC [Phaeocystidibacter luteus]KAB2814088.1 crossover junction endodeoxyribonuclease RuvC [Phaeocystidibacter luteus]